MNWISFVVETGATVIENIVSLSAVTKMAGQKYKGKRHALLIGTGTILLSVLVTIMNNISAFSFVTIAMCFCFVILFTRLTSKQSFLYRATATVLTYLVIHTIDYSVFVLTGFLYGAPDTYFSILITPSSVRTVFLLIDKLCDVILYLLLCKHLNGMVRLSEKLQAVLFLLSFAAYAFMQYLFVAIITKSLATMQIAAVLTWCFEICFAAVILALFSAWSKAEQDKQSQALLQSTNALMAENYRQLQAYQEAHAKQIHDFNHHIAAIRGLALQSHDDKVTDYANTLLSTSYEERELCHSGNDVIDAIINCKAAEAKALSISFHYSVSFPVPAMIDPVDICAVLANQIDNAFEACKQIESETERQVEVKIWQQTGKVAFFQVKNSAAVDPFNENGELVSTKKDRSQPHGLGVKNIRDTAEKYHGALQNTYQDGQFISTAFLCFEERAESVS